MNSRSHSQSRKSIVAIDISEEKLALAGSLGASHTFLAAFDREVLALAAAGKIRCRVGTRPLSEANQAFDQLRRGRVSGRIVLVIP